MWPPKEGYDLVASVYDDWYWKPFWLENERPYIQQLVTQAESAQLSLDLGCGTGTYCSVLEKRGLAVGVDPSLGMLDVARRHTSCNTMFVCARASSLPIASTRFDITIAARSLCHEPKLLRAFEELARITRSGGVCIVSDVHAQHNYPRTRIPLGADDVHIQTFKRTPEDIITIATAKGEWNVEEHREFRWKDLNWKPEDDRFFRIDRSSRLAIFFIVVLRRR